MKTPSGTMRALRAEIARLQQRVDDLEAALGRNAGAAPASQAPSLAEAILESASEGVVVADRAGRIVSVNAKTEELFGYSRAELLGQPVERLIPERSRERHPRQRGEYFEHPRARPMGRGLDLAGRRKDGGEFPVEISLSPIDTADGLQSVALITDITQRLEVERAARQAERLAALGSLSAGIAHEINNPIGIITSRIELMLIDAAEQGVPHAMVEDLHVLHRNAMRVADIAQRFLSFARQTPVERSPVELNAVVAETVELVERQMGAGLRISTALDARNPRILGQAKALQHRSNRLKPLCSVEGRRWMFRRRTGAQSSL